MGSVSPLDWLGGKIYRKVSQVFESSLAAPKTFGRSRKFARIANTFNAKTQRRKGRKEEQGGWHHGDGLPIPLRPMPFLTLRPLRLCVETVRRSAESRLYLRPLKLARRIGRSEGKPRQALLAVKGSSASV